MKKLGGRTFYILTIMLQLCNAAKWIFRCLLICELQNVAWNCFQALYVFEVIKVPMK